MLFAAATVAQWQAYKQHTRVALADGLQLNEGRPKALKQVLEEKNPLDGLQPTDLVPEQRAAKRVILLGENASNLMVAHQLATNQAFLASGHKLIVVYKKSEESQHAEYSSGGLFYFLRKYITDPHANRLPEIHGYYFVYARLKNLFSFKQ